MGTTKALLPVDGVPMASRVAVALEGAGCRPVVLAGGDPVELDHLGRRVVGDRLSGFAGPLVGVWSVLMELGGSVDAVAVAPCDVPWVRPDVVATLIARFAVHRCDVVVARTGRLQPALAVWSASSCERVGGLVRDGTRALRDAVARLDSIEVDVPAADLRNVNTRADLDRTSPCGT